MSKFKSFFSKSKAGYRRSGTKPHTAKHLSGAPSETHDEVSRLSRAVQELTVLNELAREIGASHDPQTIMKTIINKSLRSLDGEQAVITLLGDETNDPLKTYDRMMITSAQRKPFHFEQNLLGWMLINRKPLMVNDPRTDERFKNSKWEKSIKTLLSVPLIVQSGIKGVLTVYNKRGEGLFADDDARLLSIIAAQSAQVLENARLYEEEKELRRMKNELRLAARIQKELLPSAPPAVDNYEIAGKSIPAQVVGGDYFDFIGAQNGGLGICLGDVSGKGLPASLLMANIQATLRGQTMMCSSPGLCLERSNKMLYGSTDPEKFVTLFHSILNPTNHELTFSNAGHEPPLLLSVNDKIPKRLQTGGLVLGISDDFEYSEKQVKLQKGDLMLIYSDGVIDAVKNEDEPYGEDRFIKHVLNHRSESAAAIIDSTVSAIMAHTGGKEQIDDITMVAVRRID